MTIIAQALAKQNPAQGGTPPDGAPGPDADASVPAKNSAGVYPVSSILRLAHGRAPQPGAMPLRWTPAPASAREAARPDELADAPARNRTSTGAMAFGAVALLAVVVGFLANTGGETPEPRAEEALIAVGAEASAEPAREAPAPEPEPAAREAPPEPTPIVVRLQVEQIAPASAAPRGSSIVENLREELPLVPYESSAERESAAQAPRPAARRAKARAPQPDESEEGAYEEDEPEFRLEGIFWDEKKPAALINGEIVEVGDGLGDMTVKTIRRNSVEIEVAGKRQLLAF